MLELGSVARAGIATPPGKDCAARERFVCRYPVSVPIVCRAPPLYSTTYALQQYLSVPIVARVSKRGLSPFQVSPALRDWDLPAY